MNVNRPMARLLAAALGAGAISILGGTTATAGEPGGSATYKCQGDRSPSASPTPVSFTLISPPSSVRPGDAMSLSGTLDITLSDVDARQSELELATNANLIATDFTLVVTAGGKTIKAKPRVVTSSPEPIKDPWRMSADVSYSDITIPASATGRISITMPLAKTSPTTVVGTPEKVTFNAEVAQDSLVHPSRKFACWADKLGDDAAIAQIPVATTTGARPGPADEKAPGTGTAGAAPASAGGAPPALPDLSSASAEAPVPAAADAPATAEAGDATAEAGDATVDAGDAAAGDGEAAALANAAIPPETASSQTFVPGWILALFIALFPVAAIAVAVLQRRRLKALMSDASTSA